MKNVKLLALSIALSCVFSAGAYAQTSTTTANANTNASQNASNQASNQGLTQAITFNSTTPTETTSNIHYSGVTGSNTAVGLGSFSSSFSSDYCGGVAQGGISAPYVTIAAGKPVLGDPGVACVSTRASVHTMEYSATFGNAAGKALALADDAKKRGDGAQAQKYQEAAVSYAEMSGKLATAAVNMLCNLSDDVRKAYRDAGVGCPETTVEKQARIASQANTMAVANNEPTDPIVRYHANLPALPQAPSVSR